MNRHMKFATLIAAVALAGLCVSDSFAQSTVQRRLRPGIGTRRSIPSAVRRSFSMNRTVAPIPQTYRSFSFAPSSPDAAADSFPSVSTGCRSAEVNPPVSSDQTRRSFSFEPGSAPQQEASPGPAAAPPAVRVRPQPAGRNAPGTASRTGATVRRRLHPGVR